MQATDAVILKDFLTSKFASINKTHVVLRKIIFTSGKKLMVPLTLIRTQTSNGHAIFLTVPFQNIMCACSTFHLGAIKRFFFKFIPISVDDEIIAKQERMI